MPTDTLTPQQILRKRKFGEPVFDHEVENVHRHVVAVLVENHIGALNRITNLFSARGFNLESVSVGETGDPGVSRLTLTTTGNDRIIDQVERQLANLVDVLEVEDLTQGPFVERELCLMKVRYDKQSRPEMMDTLEIFRGKVVDVNPETMTFEVTGPTKKINAFVGMMDESDVVEVARSGRVAMRRELVYGD